jgi:hypothetical protein
VWRTLRLSTLAAQPHRFVKSRIIGKRPDYLLPPGPTHRIFLFQMHLELRNFGF